MKINNIIIEINSYTDHCMCLIKSDKFIKDNNNCQLIEFILFGGSKDKPFASNITKIICIFISDNNFEKLQTPNNELK